MKKFLIFLFSIFFIVGCSTNFDNNSTNNSNTENNDENETEIDNIEKRVNDTLENMTLEEKIGQMMIVYYTSSTMDNTLKSALTDVKPGGFILFKDNITTYDNTLKLIKDIKSTSDIPMFISIDQEGGNVQRLLSLSDKEVSNIPYMSEVGETNDTALAEEVGKVIAEELRAFGINMDFAPVIDVYSNKDNTVIGKRAFGSDSELVSRMGIALAKGLLDNGVIPVYKHFPGHGNTAVDSHSALPIVDKTKEELLSLDLVPFKDAIENGAEVIMIGHLAVPKITNDNIPASLSKSLITDFLKGEMGYNGLVITDALNMGALTNYYSQEEIYVKAIEAGVDLLLMPSSSRKALATIKEAVEEGIITEEQINESVRKILTLKYKYIEEDYNNYLPESTLNSNDHQEILNKIEK